MKNLIVMMIAIFLLQGCAVGTYITQHCTAVPAVSTNGDGTGSVCFSCDSIAKLVALVPAATKKATAKKAIKEKKAAKKAAVSFEGL